MAFLVGIRIHTYDSLELKVKLVNSNIQRSFAKCLDFTVSRDFRFILVSFPKFLTDSIKF